ISCWCVTLGAMANESVSSAGTPSPARALLQNRRVWIAIGATVVVLVCLSWWGVRSEHRSQALEALNSFAPFASPPLDIEFPEVVAATDKNLTVLQAGFHNGIWTLHNRNKSAWDILLTNRGQRWFSAVERSMMATFKAGNREATEVLTLNEV